MERDQQWWMAGESDGPGEESDNSQELVWWRVVVGRTEFAARALDGDEAVKKVEYFYGEQVVIEKDNHEVDAYPPEMQDYYNNTDNDIEVTRTVVI